MQKARMGRKAAGLEVWKKLKEKNPWLAEKWEKWFQRDNLLILILSGVLLMTLALPTENKKGQDNASVKQGQSGTANGTSDSLWQNAGDGNTKDRESCREEAEAFLWNGTDTAALEKRLAGILGQVSGAGEVEVMIFWESTEEKVVEKDQPVSRSNTTENDSAGGSRNVYQYEEQESTVYGDAEGGSPFVTKILAPKVKGVLVIAQGAGIGEVSSSLSEAVQALFGIGADKVKVLRKR